MMYLACSFYADFMYIERFWFGVASGSGVLYADASMCVCVSVCLSVCLSPAPVSVTQEGTEESLTQQ